jgi:hypothetical protein
MAILPLILLIPAGIFALGFAIGLSAFSTSKNKTLYAVLSGIAAVVVLFAVAFAGCVFMLGGTNFH